MNAITAEVRRRGRVSFAEFMRLALYHPEAGYYTRPRSGAGPAGRAGDFLTAPTASPVFARTIAGLVTRMAAALGEPVVFVELGAGEGTFLAEFVASLAAAGESPVSRVVAVETGEWARDRIARRCPGAEVVAALADARWPDGAVVLFASELYDAVPAHRVTVRGGELVEFFVEADEEGALRWRLAGPSGPEVVSYVGECGVTLIEGQIAEIRPAVRAMHAAHLRWCGHGGLAIVVDYGHQGRRLYNARARHGGSLVGYRDQVLIDDVLADVGEVDITAHINFDDLEHGAADAGWDRGELRPLGPFLTVHGALAQLPPAVACGEPLTAGEWSELGELKRLLTPVGMGADLKVLVQGRGPAWSAYRTLAAPPPTDA